MANARQLSKGKSTKKKCASKRGDLGALAELVENLQELNRWQCNLLLEVSGHLEAIAGREKTSGPR